MFEGLRQGLEDMKSRRLLLGYFVFATFLMLFQHSQGWAWDFSVYSLNAEYLFHDGFFMEWKRPPLVPVVLGFLQFFFSVRVSEYVFIVLTSVLFLFSVLRFSERYDLNPLYLYVMVLSPFIVFYSVLEGTELFFLSFLTLFLADIESPRSGLWLGLGFLTRYTGGIFGLFLLFQRDWKKIIYTAALSALVVFPWLLFNYLVLGHLFASIADSYALDVVERGLVTAFNPLNIFLMTGLGIPFALRYLSEMDFDEMDFLMIGMSLLVVLRQLGTKVKVRRYLFELSLLVAFLAVKGLNLFEKPEKIFYIVLSIYVVGSGFLMFGGLPLENPSVFQSASEEIGDCKAVSDRWPLLSYAGTPTGPIETQFKSEEKYIEEGYKVVEFNEDSYTVRGNGCLQGKINSTYIERLDAVYGAEVCGYLPVSTCGFESKLGEVLK